MTKIHLIPAQVGEFADAQAMSVRNQDHRSVPVAPAVLAGRLDQLLDFGAGQMFSGSDLGIWPPSTGDCPIYSGWRNNSEAGFHWSFCPGCEVTI